MCCNSPIQGDDPRDESAKGGSQRFPHIRGDAPMRRTHLHLTDDVPPHTRGCSLGPRADPQPSRGSPTYEGMLPVIPTRQEGPERLPTYEGMLRPLPGSRSGYTRFPHIRGNDPSHRSSPKVTSSGSPTYEGMFRNLSWQWLRNTRFPTYEGMFRRTAGWETHPSRFPNIRGDVPDADVENPCAHKIPPHTRGCSSSGARRLNPQ